MTDKRIRIILDSKSAEKNAKDLDKAVVGVGKSADKTTFSVNKLAAAIASAISVNIIVGYVDAWTRLENQLKRTTSTSDELLKVSGDLLKVANDTRAPIEETAGLYTALSISTSKLGYSYQQNIGITKTINNLMLESGKSAQDVAGAIRQLGQAFDKGVLNGDEFVSVAEGMPGILRAIEAQTGRTRAEIKKMAEDGELDVTLLASALSNYADEAQKAADKTTRTFEQSTIVARNNATAFIGASQALGDAVRLAGDGIVLISENLDKLATIAGAAAALYVARLIPSVVASTTAFAASTAQSIAYQAALARMAGVSTTAAVAQTALAGAARAASASLAFLGGPLGVIFLAATALVYFTSQASAAKKATDALSISTENLTKNEAAAAKLRVSDAIDAQNERLERLNANVKIYSGRLKAITDLGGKNSEAFKETSEKLTEAKGKYDEVSKSLNQLKDKYIELNNVQAGIKYLSPTTAQSLTSTVTGAVAPTETSSPVATTESSAQAEIDNAKSVTDSMRLELATRLQISTAYREVQGRLDKESFDYQRDLLDASLLEQQVLVEQRATEAREQRNEQLRAALEDEALTAEERWVLQQYYEEQQRVANELHEEELTTIREKGKLAREELDRAEFQARLANAGALGNALIQLGQGQSKKIFKVGQTLALAQAAVALPSAVLQSFQNGGGYPWGLIPAAAMLATGLKNIQNIKQAGSGLGGGGGGSVPTPSLGGGGGSGSINTNQGVQAEQAQQRRIYDFRNVKASDKIPVSALAELLEDDGAVVVLESARDDAARRGVIGVTAR